MSVADSISGALSRFGRAMTLRRNTLAPTGAQIPLDVTVYGRTKDFSPQQLVGGIVQGDTEITISNKEIAEAQWPGPPKKGDVFRFEGRNAVIQAVEPKYLGTEVLVYVCQVRG